MNINQRARLHRQFERLTATLPEAVTAAVTSDFGVTTSRIFFQAKTP